MLKLIFPIILIIIINRLYTIWWQTIISIVIMSLITIIYLNYQQLPIIINNFSSIDFMSSSLILLSILITAIIIIARTKILLLNNSPSIFLFISSTLLIVLLLAFSSTSLIYFYIWFEASLIPTLFIILFWGYQPERLQSGIYLILYTISASLPILITFILINSFSNSINITSIILNIPPYVNIYLFWLIIILGMLVKLPIFSTHLWLPKAHVEAPIAGSIILAAILLKLGGYGLLRVISIFIKTAIPTKFLIRVSIYGAFLTSLICMRQTDIKSIIAYSSVGHIGIIITGIISYTKWGYVGRIIIMIAHGLCSSALFILANTTYTITHTRRTFIIKGMLLISPSLTMWWFIFLSINIAAPPRFNLLREIILITSIISSSLITFIPLALLRFCTAIYSLNLFRITQHGHLHYILNPSNQYKRNDILLIVIHIAPIILLILKPIIFTT